MENQGNNNPEIVDIREVARKIFAEKWLIVKVSVVTFILSCAYILPEPRTYTSEVTLAPEMSSMSAAGGLSDIAASFGFDIGGMQSVDAIYPTLYPEIMTSSGFVVGLFDVQVKSLDGEIDMPYYDYLNKHQKISFWKKPFVTAVNWVKGFFVSPDDVVAGTAKGKGGIDGSFLTRRQSDIVEKINDKVTCTVDKKTDVITITVSDQDRLICKSLADSVRVRLQQYITDYRTKKARNDVEYYKMLTDDAMAKYAKTRREYSAYMDSHTDVTLTSYRVKQEDIENKMQLEYNAYMTFNTQYQAAMAKLQDRTPSFTVIQCASVPVKAAKPKRMIFVAAMLFLAFFGTIVYIFRQFIIDNLLRKTDQPK